MTKRPQNVCKSCGYTWYPRGKSVSLKCPKCGGGKVSIAGGGLFAGILLVIGAVALFGGHGKPRTETANATPPVLETSKPESPAMPTPVPEVQPRPPVSTEEQTRPSQVARQVFTETTTAPQDKEDENAGGTQMSSPSLTCRKDEGSFISWNNCMWRECAQPQFRELGECRNKQRN